MTIDEAIEHAEWCAENSCGECAEDHAQLAEWLRELKDMRKLLKDIDWFLDRVEDCTFKGWLLTINDFKERMRKLGIEVRDE